MELNQSNWQAAVLSACTLKDGRKLLSCGRAIELGQEFGASLAEVGQFCQSNDVKIADCALGCFGASRKGG